MRPASTKFTQFCYVESRKQNSKARCIAQEYLGVWSYSESANSANGMIVPRVGFGQASALAQLLVRVLQRERENFKW